MTAEQNKPRMPTKAATSAGVGDTTGVFPNEPPALILSQPLGFASC